jgi:hypothetical protein
MRRLTRRLKGTLRTEGASNQCIDLRVGASSVLM